MKKTFLFFTFLILLPLQIFSLEPEAIPGTETKIFAGIKSGAQFCVLTGPAIGYFANVAQVLVKSIGVSTKKGSSGDCLTGAIALALSYLFQRFL